MRPWHRLSLLVIGVAIINAATFAMLERNLRNNVYPTDADTIIIPIFETAIGPLIVLPALVAIALMPLAAWVSRLSSKGPWWRSGLNLLILGSYAMVGLFAIAGAATWAIPEALRCCSLLRCAACYRCCAPTRVMSGGCSLTTAWSARVSDKMPAQHACARGGSSGR